jgi:hypothetical protein
LFECFVPKKKLSAVLAKLRAENMIVPNIISEENFLPEKYFSKFFIADFNARIDLLKWMFSSVRKKFFLFQQIWQFSFQQNLYAENVKRFLATKKYLIGAGDHWFWESLFYHEAQKTNCTSIIVQHGLMGEFNYPMLSKKYWVWGKHDFDIMLNNFKASADELEIVGSAHFDSFSKKIKDDSSPLEKKYITFFTQPYFKYEALGNGLYAEVVNWFLQLNDIAKKLNKKLQIKWHQLDKASYYPNFSDDIKTTNENLADVLGETCIAITVDSAIIFETGIIGVPTIQLSHKKFERFIDFSKDNLSMKCSSKEDLQNIVEKLISSKFAFENQQKLTQENLEKYLANKNHVADRMLELLK